MIIKITCPGCQTEGTMILRDARFQGPYKCWKCAGLYTITLENGLVSSCEPLSEEEFRQWQEREDLKKKQ